MVLVSRSVTDDRVEAMLIYSMSVAVDGFIADREGGFGWTAPSEELLVSTSRRRASSVASRGPSHPAPAAD
jgi:hypothetical protein